MLSRWLRIGAIAIAAAAVVLIIAGLVESQAVFVVLGVAMTLVALFAIFFALPQARALEARVARIRSQRDQ